jgi:hypothetical protein
VECPQLSSPFVDEFAGMTEDGIDLPTLERVREAMIAALQSRIDDNVAEFLLSVEREAPNAIGSACRRMSRSCRACAGS